MKKHKIIILSIIAIIVLIIIAIGVFLYNKNNELVDVVSITTDSNYENIVYDEVENVWNEEVLGILSIEEIGLKATVREGTSNEVLNQYIGHIEETATYDGNIGLAAHNRGGDFAFFARINELEKGDIIKYQTKFYTREYKVDNIQAIYETDWSLLEPTEENKLTLITCITNKRPQRLCVQATEIK